MYEMLTRPGLLQHWVVVSDERVIMAPKHLKAAENASLATAGVTAWSAIREGLDGLFDGELRDWREGNRLQGKTILTQGTGGVSCFAIQVRFALTTIHSNQLIRLDCSSPRCYGDSNVLFRHKTRAC